MNNQSIVLTTGTGTKLADVEIESKDNGQHFVRVKAPGRKIDVAAIEIMLVVDEFGQYFALDATVNRINPNGIKR